MQRQPFRAHPKRRPAALALLLVTAALAAACAGTSNVGPAINGAATVAAAVNSQADSLGTAAAASTPGAITAAAGAQSTARCQTIGDAYLDFENETPFLAALGSDGAYAANTPDSPTYINIPKVRADLDTLGTLPNGTLGPLSPAIAQVRQLVDQVDANFKSGGKPFTDGSGNGQKVLDDYLKIAQPLTVVAEAFASACPHYAASTTAPDAAGYQIGQTASVGDLRLTLDTVAVPPPSANPMLQPGNRYLLAHITIKNAGTAPLQVTGMETSMKDGAGTVYGFDPFASNAAAGSMPLIDGSIPAGGTLAGLVSYQLPATAGDLLWIFQDYGQNRAIFAVPASAIDISQAGNAATADTLKSSAGATMTAFMNLVATSDAASVTDTPAP